MTESRAQTGPHAVVVDYLMMTGWSRASAGAAGELWRRGQDELAVPSRLQAASAEWERLSSALAFLDDQRPSDVSSAWSKALRVYLSLSDTPQQRGVPGRVEMEVHLDGISVTNHEARAYEFGAFVMRTSESVKELVKSSKGLRHHARNLLIAGGIEPGSVQVTFREPDRSDHTAMITDPPETAEGVALTYLSVLWDAAEQASTSPDTEGLRARLAPLTVKARQSVARVADTVTDAGWTISGTIRRGSEEAPMRLGLAGSQVLSTVAREGMEEEKYENVPGTLDGWVWSKSELTLITDDRGTIRVSVPMSLQGLVGELHATPETRVVARLAVFSRIAHGTQGMLYRAYSLDSIHAEVHDTLPDA